MSGEEGPARVESEGRALVDRGGLVAVAVRTEGVRAGAHGRGGADV
ncbi:hypothetical protein [Streptomyces sp. NBC_00102]|nr:hypothetical protein [Streptomyces sp. NBC_00102]